MEMNVIVLYARPWNMVDENTGKSRSGVSVHYLATDTLTPPPVAEGQEAEEFGYQPCKQSISIEDAKALKTVPGIYKAKLEMRASKGQNILAIAGLEFISDFAEKAKK